MRIGIDNNFEKHSQMIARSTAAFIALLQSRDVYMFDNCIYYSYGMILGN
ncbi:hypothetical protein SAMN05660413_02625 [Salegentibacter flavus]|uniref:Uncharacterized protein n=1 Tax=Salegentibacter flavus TaxID=287099 RepID=A0A1I5BZR7_9FLAO|nr:hypothetical protein SAMN05660413_02625 [Salegentibacter flavus]